MSIRNLYKTMLFVALSILGEASVVAQNNREMLLDEEWDTYSQTSNRQVNGWYFCKNGINDESIVQRSNLHAYLTSGTTAGSGTTIATPWLSEVADTFSFRIYGSYLMGHTAQVEFGFIPDTATITNASDVCAQFIPYDTVELSVSNQWQRTTRDMHPYYAIHGTTHRFAIRLNNSYHQQLYLDEIQAWIPAEEETSSCPENTTMGRDFWVAFIVNGGSQRPQELRLCASADNACSVTVTNPLTGWSQSASVSAGGFTMIPLPNDDAIPVNYSTLENKGFHVTATDDIHLAALFTQLASSGATSFLPTPALDTQYIVLDYPADPSRDGTGATVTILATQPNTTVRYIPPCLFYNDPSSVVGTPVTRTFTAAGQTLTLMSNHANVSLSGMRITADKPIAVFQGNQITGVPYNTPSSDLLFDQSMPVSHWGKEYVLMPTVGRSVGDKVRVVADSACTVSLSTGAVFTLAAGGVQEFDLPASSPCVLTADKPVSVGLCSKGSDWNAEPGDGSLVMVPPTGRSTCHSVFSTFVTQRINTWYVAVATTQPATMTLDGNSIASQFQPIGTTGYSYARIPISSGTHSLDNSNGAFVGWTYGVGNVESYIYSLGYAIEHEALGTCQLGNGEGTDFWATFLCNDDNAPAAAISLIATGMQGATVTVTNPVTGWARTATLPAGDKVQINLPTVTSMPSGAPHNLGYHITSTAPVTLYACNYIQGSWDFGQVLPTYALGGNYLVQNYSNNSDHPANLAFVATENGTQLSMVLPCTVTGLSLPAGSNYTVTLDAGQSLLLRADVGSDFSGMEVHSNCKPFALFQGCAAGRVGDNGTNSGRDHFFEQALPLDIWGTEFVADASLDRTEGDRVLVTAGGDNCMVQINGLTVATLMRGQSYEYTLNASTTAHIVTSQPAYACLYLVSYRNGGSNGDPGAATLPPVDRWVCHSNFMVHQCNNNPSNQYYIANPYINIIADTAAAGAMSLDGIMIPASQFSPVAGTPYCHARMHVAYGAHSIDCADAGTFSARVYGLGRWVGFNYNVDMVYDSLERCELSSCPTSLGHDFWLMFLANGGDQTPHQTLLTAVGDSNATITVSNPSTGWSTTTSLNANQSVQISVPLASSISEQSNTPLTKRIGLHVTSTSAITLYAKNYKFKCNDLTLVHPSHALGTQYIIQDFAGDVSHSSVTGAEVGFVATLDNTTLTMVLPCNLINNSAHAGDTLTVNLMQGESYQLIASAPGSFSGMEVTSNGKPFAAFQGNRAAYIPLSNGGADLIYEQAVPVDFWGTNHVVVSSFGRSTDLVRITSSEDDCQVYDNGTFVRTLQKGETCDITLSGSAHRFTSTKKVCVGRYLCGSQTGGNPGDPASVMIPPIELGAQYLRFNIPSATDISNHYINVVANNSHVAGITLDGNSISSQFTPIDGSFSYAQIAVSQGIHLLESASGPIVADYYGLGDYAGCASLVARSYCEQEPVEESSCPDHTNKGNDFWMTFLPIESASELRLTFATDSVANITVFGPNGSFTTTLLANGSETRIVGSNDDINTINTPFPGCYHIVSDHGIWLYANNDMEGTYKSGESATILPTSALDTVYIAQDYPPYAINRAVSFVATQDNTVLTMVLPCPLRGTSLLAGDTFTVTLQRGQAYLINSDSPSVGFSGMRVVSNGKPFAMFHGGLTTRVPVNAVDGGDLIYEQAISPRDWGTDFIVPGFSYQGGNSYIRITAAEDNTQLTIDGTLVSSGLNARECYEYVIHHTSQCRISANKPVSVILYMSSHREAGNVGDPASVTIPPLDRGVCKAMFRADNIGSTNSHYLTVFCPTDIDGSLQLDGANLSSGATVLGNYTIHRLPISPGRHSLENSEGTFVAFVYGIGNWKAYAYPLGYAFDAHPLPEVPMHQDTLSFADSVCQGQAYLLPAEVQCGGISYFPPSGLIYLSPAVTAETGILERWSSWVEDSIVHHIHLTLTVLPTYSTDLQMSLIPGDTVFFQGDTLTEACQRTYLLQSVYGCDSLVNITLSYAEVSLSSSIQGGCPGEEVTLTAEGTHLFLWSSTPYDPELDSQQGQNPIVVHPTTTTTYSLLDALGQTIASVTVGVEPPPTLCIETNRDFIDFDHPVLTFHDCSPDRYSTSWIFSDGYILSGERARRQFQHPLPDTITVTLRSCNRYNCCADTTIGFHPEIRSVWFPNIFTPDLQQNNRFGAVTSCQVAEFEIFLYNRWGLLVWHSTDINTPWDGTHEGTPVPQGAYAYRWYLKDIHGDRWSGTGTVTLIR